MTRQGKINAWIIISSVILAPPFFFVLIWISSHPESALYGLSFDANNLRDRCWHDVQERLVAPSTAAVVESRIVETGSPGMLTIFPYSLKLNRARLEFEAAQKETAKAQALVDSIDSDTKRLVEMERGDRATMMRKVMQNAAVDRRSALPLAQLKEAQAKAAVDAAENEKADYLAHGWGEVVFIFDAQNRASAMLRMEGVCTFHRLPGGRSLYLRIDRVAEHNS